MVIIIIAIITEILCIKTIIMAETSVNRQLLKVIRTLESTTIHMQSPTQEKKVWQKQQVKMEVIKDPHFQPQQM